MDEKQSGDFANPYTYDAPSDVMHNFSSNSDDDDAAQWFGKLNMSSCTVICYNHTLFASER